MAGAGKLLYRGTELVKKGLVAEMSVVEIRIVHREHGWLQVHGNVCLTGAGGRVMTRVNFTNGRVIVGMFEIDGETLWCAAWRNNSRVLACFPDLHDAQTFGDTLCTVPRIDEMADQQHPNMARWSDYVRDLTREARSRNHRAPFRLA